MTAKTIIGWTTNNGGRRSHLVGSADVVVGTREAIDATVKFLLCGATGDFHGIADNPDTAMCARCVGVAFKLARREELPEMLLRQAVRS